MRRDIGQYFSNYRSATKKQIIQTCKLLDENVK